MRDNGCGQASQFRAREGRKEPHATDRILPGLRALGVVPEFQGRAIDALLYRKLYEALRRQVRLAVNYVLEDNVRMNNALRNLQAKPLRRHRVYQVGI